MEVRVDQEKAKKVMEDRDIDLFEVAEKIEMGEILGVVVNKNRPWQYDFHIIYKGYPIACPCEMEENGFFLRTAYPDRRLWKKYNYIEMEE